MIVVLCARSSVESSLFFLEKWRKSVLFMLQFILFFFFLSRYGPFPEEKVFLFDFEKAAIGAVREVFPNATVKGCNFHFRQALYRRVAELGLKRVYNSKRPLEVREWLQKIMSMSHLPANEVPVVWEVLQHPPSNIGRRLQEKLRQFSTYVDRNWIKSTCGFPPALWTHFDHDGPRTTNVAEGYHSRLAKHFGMVKPGYRNFLHWLQGDHDRIQIRMEQLFDGAEPEKRPWKYIEGDAKVKYNKIDLSRTSYAVGLVHGQPSRCSSSRTIALHQHVCCSYERGIVDHSDVCSGVHYVLFVFFFSICYVFGILIFIRSLLKNILVTSWDTRVYLSFSASCQVLARDYQGGWPKTGSDTRASVSLL